MLPALRDKMKDKDKANIGLVELILEKFSQDKEKVVMEEINKSIKKINNINFKDQERLEVLMKQDVMFNQQKSSITKQNKKYN